MKKLIIFILTAMFMLTLTGCDNTSTADPYDGQAFMFEIMHITYEKAPDIDILPAYECIFEDDKYYYVLPNHESQYYIVTYANGDKQNIKDALVDGNITIADLDAHGIWYEKSDKYPQDKDVKEVINIIDTSTGLPFNCVEEPFYEDYSHIYIFGSPISEYITVEYSDGSTQNVKEALKGGHITIADLDAFGIEYFAEPKLIENIIDLTESGELVTADALEGFYLDENYVYRFGSIKSQYVIVYYKDGTEQNIKDALADGKIKITDLDWFGIGYGKEPKKSK